MKNLCLSIAICFANLISHATTYYVATNGSDNNPGTLSAPFATWEKLSSVLVAGDIAYIRGGTYRTTKSAASSVHIQWQNLHGTSTNLIKIWAYPGEYPVFNLDNITPTYTDPTILAFKNSEYVHIKGIRITGLKQHTGGTGISRGFHLETVNHCTIEFVEVDHVGGYGIYLRDNVNDNYFLNCDVHHLDDRYSNPGAWSNSNGFDCSNGINATRNTFEGCRVWWCSDDGFDLYGTNGIQTFKNCWSFWNGYEPGTFTPRGDGDGFKLGPDAGGMHNTLLRTLTNCVAFENKEHGFNQNVGDMKYKLYNNTTFKNGATGYMWDYVSPAPVQDFKNNVSYMDVNARRGAETNGSNNSWNGIVTVSSADFLSISSTGADGPRGADGSLPVLNFLHLSASSDLINAGINVGLSFLSSAPDMGAYESGGTVANTPPVSNAGADKAITLPANSVSLSGSGTDADGSITGYAWTKLSGPSATITTAAAASTTVTSLTQGVYQFQLQVTDNAGATATDVVQVTVNAAATNTPPVANAGNTQSIVLPNNSIVLSGAGTDANGTIASYSWRKISGPSPGTIASTTSASTSITSLTAGTYLWELTVTDNQGAKGLDSVYTIVNTSAGSAAVSTGKVIRVNVYNGTDPYSDSKWNNWKPSSNVSSSTFTYENGSASSVYAVVTKQKKILDNGAGYLPGVTICPTQTLRYTSANQTTRTLTIKGLSPTKQYSFEFYASSSLSGNQTTFTINSAGQTINTYNNATGYAAFTNITPTSSGTLAISLSSVGTWNYLSAFAIIEQSGTIAGRSTSTEPMNSKELPASIGEESGSFGIIAYPVPFVNSFTLNLQGGEEGRYEVKMVDMTGRIVLQKAITKNSLVINEIINGSALPKGVYVLAVVGPDGKQTTQKIIKN